MARQPPPSSGVGQSSASNEGGQGETGLPSSGNRSGHVSHSLLMGTINFPDNGEGQLPDLNRVGRKNDGFYFLLLLFKLIKLLKKTNLFFLMHSAVGSCFLYSNWLNLMGLYKFTFSCPRTGVFIHCISS